jgi:hypothetical protein
VNCFSPSESSPVAPVWQQYGFRLGAEPGNNLVGYLENWTLSQLSNDAKTSGLFNYPVIVIPGMPINMTTNKPFIPKGSTLTVTLINDPATGNVIGATFTASDDSGAVYPPVTQYIIGNGSFPGIPVSPPLTKDNLAPITSFNLNIVMSVGGTSTTFSSGSGTITYSAKTALTVFGDSAAGGDSPPCVPDYDMLFHSMDTGESSNSLYGLLAANPKNPIQQSFNVSLTSAPM